MIDEGGREGEEEREGLRERERKRRRIPSQQVQIDLGIDGLIGNWQRGV